MPHTSRSFDQLSLPSRLSHIHLFFIGWLYYLLLPLVAVRFGLYHSINGFQIMDRYSTPNDLSWAIMFLYITLFLFCYILGTYIPRCLPRLLKIEKPIKKKTGLLILFYGIMLVSSTLSVRESLFKGYTEGTDIFLVGPIAALQMALLLQYLAAKSSSMPYTRWVLILLVCSSIILLSMGGRLYVLITGIALYFYWWKWSAKRRGARRLSIFMLVVSPLFLASIGMLRMGYFDISLFDYAILVESWYTSISAFTFMSGNSWSLIDYPSDFLCSFLNIVPTPLWPDKGLFQPALIDSHIQFEAPFGGISIVVSTIGNFGYIGGLIFVTFVGYMIESLHKKSHTVLGRALYCYISSLLPFMFFRDPFQIQVKVVMTGILLIWLNRILSLPVVRRPAISITPSQELIS